MVKSATVPRPFSLKKKTDAISRKKACIRVFYSLLLICYLEVCLWSFCLSANCVEGSAYLSRETQNLSATNACAASVPSPLFHGKVNFAYSDWALKLERRVRHVSSALLSSGRDHSPHLRHRRETLAETLPFNLNQGVPAPYTGIAAVLIVSSASSSAFASAH